MKKIAKNKSPEKVITLRLTASDVEMLEAYQDHSRIKTATKAYLHAVTSCFRLHQENINQAKLIEKLRQRVAVQDDLIQSVRIASARLAEDTSQTDLFTD